MSTDTRELRQALEEAQAEVREARRDADERPRLERELLLTRDELAATTLALEELKKQLGPLTAQQQDREAIDSELRRLRAEAEVGLSARQRYERNKVAERLKDPLPVLGQWKAGSAARWLVGLLGVGLLSVGIANGSIHPLFSLLVGAVLVLWSITAGDEN